jgi:hypothetical protein
MAKVDKQPMAVLVGRAGQGRVGTPMAAQVASQVVLAQVVLQVVEAQVVLAG